MAGTRWGSGLCNQPYTKVFSRVTGNLGLLYFGPTVLGMVMGHQRRSSDRKGPGMCCGPCTGWKKNFQTRSILEKSEFIENEEQS